MFEMPVVGVPLLECICWDHDRFGKDYLGEFDIPLEDIFANGELLQPVGSLPACSIVAHSTDDFFFVRSLAEMVHASVET